MNEEQAGQAERERLSTGGTRPCFGAVCEAPIIKYQCAMGEGLSLVLGTEPFYTQFFVQKTKVVYVI